LYWEAAQPPPSIQYKQMSLAELMNIEVTTVSPQESTVGQNPLDEHHPELGTNPFMRSPLVELQRAAHGKVTCIF
jgi:hypothetical protein